MKILHIIDSGGLYGAEIMLLNLVAEQIKMGLEPTIASIGEKKIAEKPIEAEALQRGFKVRKFRIMAGPNLSGAFEVLRFVKSGGYDLLHSHGYKGNILFGLMPRSVRRLPLVSTIHGYTSTNGFSKIRIYEWLDAKSLKLIDSVVLVNKGMLNHPRIKRLSGVNFQVVNNGIAIITDNSVHHSTNLTNQLFNDLDQEIIEFCKQGFVIGSIGRLSTEKGYDDLIRAVQLLAKQGIDTRLVIIGEGSQRDELEKLVVSAKLSERVFFPGYREDARGYLPFFDVFVISSLTEGMPITLLEAMQAKVPIVATAVGGIPEVLDNGNAGLLVQPGQPDGIAAAVQRFSAENELGKNLTNAAYKRVITLYTSKAMADRYLQIYQGLLN